MKMYMGEIAINQLNELRDHFVQMATSLSTDATYDPVKRRTIFALMGEDSLHITMEVSSFNSYTSLDVCIEELQNGIWWEGMRTYFVEFPLEGLVVRYRIDVDKNRLFFPEIENEFKKTQ
jgi:hypothetical protein